MEQLDLAEYFLNHLRGQKDLPENRLLGTEYEMFCLAPQSAPQKKYRPLRMSGQCGVYQMVSHLENIGREGGVNWKQHHEGDNLIGLSNDCLQSITIEPGGQIEFAGSPLSSLSKVQKEISDFLKDLQHAVGACGAKILSIGVNPLFTLDEIPLVDKKRYHIMFPYMKQKGELGQYMMKASASTQVSLDYFSLEDLSRKFVFLNRLAPFITAIFANSPLLEGRDTQYQSFRGRIWRNTDPDRSGAPEAFLKDSFQLSDYIEWARKTPTYFLNRGEEIINCTEFEFGELMEGKFPKIVPTPDDWKQHLGTLFPDVRIKNILEVRGADALLPEDMIAVPALLKALVYNEQALEKVQNLLMDLPLDRFPLYTQAGAKDGLRAEVNGLSFQKIAQQIFEHALSALGSEEEQFLIPFFEKYTKHGATPAEKIIQDFAQYGKKDVWKWIDRYLGESFPVCNS